MSTPTPVPPRRSASRVRATRARRGAGRALAAMLLGLAMAGSATAFAPEAAPPRHAPVVAPERPGVERVLRGAAQDGGGASPTLIERVTARLRKLPLRPVTIGEEPRTPDDPEPGAGLTIFIRF